MKSLMRIRQSKPVEIKGVENANREKRTESQEIKFCQPTQLKYILFYWCKKRMDLQDSDLCNRIELLQRSTEEQLENPVAGR